MPKKKKAGGWWHTAPGVMTALAAIITALTGVFVALHSTGVLPLKPKSTPPAAASQSSATKAAAAKPAASSSALNLLAEENGGQVVSAPNETWAITIDGKDFGKYISQAPGQEVVYGFRDNGLATFDSFAILVPEAGDNIKEFELLVAQDAAGPFTSIGTFNVQNARLQDPYQTFTFTPATGRYLKFRLVSSQHPSYAWLTEFRLFGRLHE